MTGNSSISYSLTDTWHAWVQFRRGKKPSNAILRFEAELETNLLHLCAELNTGKYQHGPYDHKIVNEKKRRDIAVAQVRDRVVHRLMYDYLVPIIDPKLDYDVWSCRPGKGLHAGLKRTQQLLGQHAGAWVWRADITKFFDSVDQAVLRSCLSRVITDPRAIEVLDKVIRSYEADSASQPASGIPIGNLTSQIFANLYLNEFDRYVRHVIKPLGYVRYGDDFIIIVPTKNAALAIQDEATEWLETKLKLRVHRRNNIVLPARRGLFFLGHKIYPNSPLSVDKTMIRKLQSDLTLQNMISYQAMALPRRHAKLLPWLILL